MSPRRARRLRAGSLVFAAAALGMGAASIAILSPLPDVATAGGRHLWAGALANVSLSLILAMLAAGPLRRGERWAFWACALPFAIYGIPILVLDATHVARARLAMTLAPQVLGLLVGIAGLLLTAPAVFGRTSDEDGNVAERQG